MRLLVACPHCNRQYDATKIGIGRKFRCHCGAVLTVHEPKGHDAAVVCCAHCGAPRSEGALKCEYCGADFTLHDRDLDTVCPHCFTRVSRSARYCHNCGKEIRPEMLAGEKSKLSCPACGKDHLLSSRAWGDISALECNGCAGIWLSSDSFRHLTDEAAAEGMNVEGHFRPQQARAPETEKPPDRTVHYRPCPVCGQLMQRQNYGRQSGVVIDACKYHGVWFDADELPRILDWVRSGGLARANEAAAMQQQESEGVHSAANSVLASSDDDGHHFEGSPFWDALANLLRIVIKR